MITKKGDWYVAEGPITEYDLLSTTAKILANHMKRGNALENPEQVKAYLTQKLHAKEHEVFCVMYLDNRHRLIHYDEVFRGTINGASVHPREIAKDALTHNAAAVILAHNHPSGVSTPSEADRRITEHIIKALNLFDIRVIDHIIIGDTPYSFAETGLL